MISTGFISKEGNGMGIAARRKTDKIARKANKTYTGMTQRFNADMEKRSKAEKRFSRRVKLYGGS